MRTPGPTLFAALALIDGNSKFCKMFICATLPDQREFRGEPRKMKALKLLSAVACIFAAPSPLFASNCEQITASPTEFFEATSPVQLEDCLNSDDDLPAYRSLAGQTLMHFAAKYAQDPTTVLVLAKSGVSVNEQDDFGKSPLHWAASRDDNRFIVPVLLAIGADRYLQDGNSNRPFDLVEHENLPARMMLATEDANVGFSLTRIDANEDPMSCENYLTPEFFQQATPSQILYCSKGAKAMGRGKGENTALHLAARYSSSLNAIAAVLAPHQEKAQRLLDAKNERGRTPLHLAARYSNTHGMLTALIIRGAKINALSKPEKSWNRLETYGTSPLHFASYRSDEFRTMALLELLAFGAATDTEDIFRTSNDDVKLGRQTPLYYAIATGSVHDEKTQFNIRLLLEAERTQSSIASVTIGWVPNEGKDSEGRSVLHLAALRDAPREVIELLLNYGFDPTDPDDKGRTPLSAYAKMGSEPETMKLLIEHALRPRMLDVVLTAYQKRRRLCGEDNDGATALAYVKRNSALNQLDSSGATISPRAELKNLCEN